MSITQTTGTKIYQGWRITFDETRTKRTCWVATRTTKLGTFELAAPSETTLRINIEKHNEEQSEGALV